jgi:hypothetical protein
MQPIAELYSSAIAAHNVQVCYQKGQLMGDLAHELITDPLAVDGLENLFAEDSPLKVLSSDSTVQDSTESGTRSVQDVPGGLVHPISVDEAARLLNISSNAVCKRLRKGTLVGKKIAGKFKDEWLVEGAGLIEVLNVDFSSVQDSPSEIRDEEWTVQDQTGDSDRSVQESPDATLTLLALVEKQSAKLEAAAGQIGYLQAKMEEQNKQLEQKTEQLKLLTDSQHKRSWFQKFSSWFLGR